LWMCEGAPEGWIWKSEFPVFDEVRGAELLVY
jgi:hypothetical protein